ncbi:MAG: alpha/beta fold hydrolase [Planctomycetes bacterium]|nr:alpha/beta fold hydrolase [Planctomycetota bacterium]
MNLRAAIVWALGTLLLASCFLSPKLVGTRPTTLDEARVELEACALNANRLSDPSREVLAVFDLCTLYDEDPRAALRELHARAVAEPQRRTLFALAEGSYLLGRRMRDREAYLAAAVYAYLYLLGDEVEVPNPYDRRFRWAAELYNDGLLRALLDRKARIELVEGVRALPTGSLELHLDPAALWTPAAFRFEPADLLTIYGLRLRLRDSGLGVPLIATRLQKPAPDEHAYVAARVAPVTAFLRIEGGLEQLASGLHARLELHSGYDAERVDVAGREVPLETERSAALARGLDDSALWRFSIAGLFGGERPERSNRLILAQPYARGRVPVVFVHGTASSPAYWAELFNTLWSDPLLRRSTQMWFFQYATGNPILYSAAELRDALRATVAELDPAGTDEALRRMVLIGHSQGGLLVRLLVSHGDMTWLEELSGRTLDQLALAPDEDALLRRCLEFEPLEYVQRVVFVSTPHRGSFISARWYSRLLGKLISFPSDVVNLGASLLQRQASLLSGALPEDHSSIAGMAPDSQLVKRLKRTPLAPGVSAHSVISIGAADPGDPRALATADDGVVAYASAHLEGVASEDLIPSAHSCQSHPLTIQAIRRILREHLAVRP